MSFNHFVVTYDPADGKIATYPSLPTPYTPRYSWKLGQLGLVGTIQGPCGCFLKPEEQQYFPAESIGVGSGSQGTIECLKCGATFQECDAHEWADSFVDE